jgi:hypothetical protein
LCTPSLPLPGRRREEEEEQEEEEEEEEASPHSPCLTLDLTGQSSSNQRLSSSLQTVEGSPHTNTHTQLFSPFSLHFYQFAYAVATVGAV